MDAYLDSGVIVKLYVQEANSAEAIGLVNAFVPPYKLTSWQSLEVKNAIRLKAFRQEITLAQAMSSIAAFESDIALGRWVRPAYPGGAVERKAEELSASHSASVGCRMLDIIHVAAALATGAKEFITFDIRQAALAKRLGLEVRP